MISGDQQRGDHQYDECEYNKKQQQVNIFLPHAAKNKVLHAGIARRSCRFITLYQRG